MVNRMRAAVLGISLEDHAELIDEIVDEAVALNRQKDEARKE